MPLAPRTLSALVATALWIGLAPAAPAAPDAAPADAAAAYRFALGKMLAAEGDLPGAVQDLAAVVSAVPEDPYVRLEYASVLADLAQAAPSADAAQGNLEEAARQAEKAVQLDSGNLDAWRVVAQTRLALADRDPDSLDAAVAALERVQASAPDDYRSALTLGQLYLSLRQPARAVDVFHRVEELTGQSRYVDSLLAQALIAAGRQPEGEEVLGRILAGDPESLEVRLDLARLESERGDHGAALETLEGAPREQRESDEVTRRVALELYFLGRSEEALQRVDQLLAEGDAPGLLAVKALVLSALGRQDDFTATLEAMDAADPHQLELARLLEERGAADQAEAVLRHVLDDLGLGTDAVDDNARRLAWQARVSLARLVERRGRPGEAAALLEPLLSSTDGEVRAAVLQAHTEYLLAAGRGAEAVERLRREPDGPQVRALTLEALLASGREHRGERLFRHMQAAGVDEALLAVRAAQSRERYDLTVPALERLVEGDPSPAALFYLGSAYERTGRRPEAVGTFRRLLAAHPDFADALNYLGYMWAERGENLQEALEMVERAVAASPDNGAYADSLGWVHYQLGDYDLALKYLQRAATLGPEDPEIFEHLGDVHRVLGDLRRAREFYLRALALAEGNDAEVQRKLDALPTE